MSPVARTFPISVADDPASNRYELVVDGVLAATANYQLIPGKMMFTYTELMPGFEGRGLGQQLASAVLDDVRQRGLVIAAHCPFFVTYIEDHPDYRDLVDPPMADPMPELRVVAG
jgi:predicted GNAT family acetyltransferase